MILLTGVINSLTDNFRALRDARVDKYVVETNKLLIRLDKLISPDAPSEGSKRKGKTVIKCRKNSENSDTQHNYCIYPVGTV